MSIGPRAHPRSRGENANQAFGTQQNKGSSPLTRGKRGGPTHAGRATGLIPAHAGKTCAGGEVGGTQVGSSPLTRGKRSRRVAMPKRQRLIPAHAGKTLPDLRFYRADRSDLGKP